ncbi:MAG: MFS transporter [Planctomycetes bacterium]|nr:MFS transporter [Planctomycetota bacterium]
MHPYLRTRLAVQMFLAGAVFGAYQPVLPPYLKSLGFTEFQIGLALASANIATILSPLLVGQAADRWMASERLLAILNAACGGVLLLAVRVSGFVPFLAMFFIAMLVTVPLFSMATSIALQNLPDGARDFPAIRACGTFGHVTGANLLSGWLTLTHRSFSDSLILAGLIAFASAGYALTLPHTPPRHDAAGRSAIGRAAGMLRDPGFALFLGLLFLVQLFGTAYYARGPVFLLGSVSKEGLSSLMSIGQIVEIFVVLLLPLLYGRLGAKATMSIGLGAWALRFGLWAWGGSTALLVAAVALHGICFACGRIAATIYVDRICPQDARASAQSLLSVLVDGSGAVLGNLIISQVVTHYTVAGAPDWRSIWLVPTIGLSGVFLAFVIGFRARRGEIMPAARIP